MGRQHLLLAALVLLASGCADEPAKRAHDAQREAAADPEPLRFLNGSQELTVRSTLGTQSTFTGIPSNCLQLSTASETGVVLGNRSTTTVTFSWEPQSPLVEELEVGAYTFEWSKGADRQAPTFKVTDLVERTGPSPLRLEVPKVLVSHTIVLWVYAQPTGVLMPNPTWDQQVAAAYTFQYEPIPAPVLGQGSCGR